MSHSPCRRPMVSDRRTRAIQLRALGPLERRGWVGKAAWTVESRDGPRDETVSAWDGATARGVNEDQRFLVYRAAGWGRGRLTLSASPWSATRDCLLFLERWKGAWIHTFLHQVTLCKAEKGIFIRLVIPPPPASTCSAHPRTWPDYDPSTSPRRTESR